MAVPRETVKKRLVEALLSDECTPSANRQIQSMLEELAKKNPTQERIDAMGTDLTNIMSNLSGETIDEFKGRVKAGGVGFFEWFRIRRR